ncbi:MAG: LPS assembly protein LptD [Desulfobacterales bacterium]|nr:LPS assembly protein LptD [Desulfobacterales bacterium]
MYRLFSRKSLPLTVVFTLFLCLFAITCARAATPKMENPKEISWHISALMVTYDNERELYVAEDNVVITGGQTRLEADYVEFSNKTKDAFAQGNVLFISGGDTITCNAMQINLLTEKGTINKGTIFIQEDNYYISGENLRKTGEFTYDAEKGTITTCNGDTPDWKITGKDIEVTIEGYGTASHTALWAKKVPVVYSPYLVFPVKNKRQTGLLFPRVSISDKRGFEYEQPLFIAISRSTDATVYAHHMSDRGTKISGEFRYVLDDKSKGMMIVDYLDDDKLGDGSDDTQDVNYGYSSTIDRTNHERYWFRMKHDQALPYGFNAKLDIDFVSDSDYLLEFKDGFTGYHDTNSGFETMFGRSLDEYTDKTRKNSLLATKSWSKYNLNIQALWYDNVVARQQNSDDTTLQQLPSIEFDGARQQIGESNFYYGFDSEYRYFFRQDPNPSSSTPKVNGQRADFYSRFFYPTNLGKSFFFEPYLGARGTIWDTENFTDNYGNDKDIRTRGLYDFGAQLSTSLNRIFNLNNSFAEKIKHEIVPKLEYKYLPEEDQDDLPYFDDIDDIDQLNLIQWSLTNTITSRKKGRKADGTVSNQYKELAWFRLYQNYLFDWDKDAVDAPEKPWQDLKLKYELNPFHYLSSDGDIALDPYNQHFTEIKVGVTLRDNRGDSIYTSYRYTKGSTTHTWLTRFNARITSYLMAYYSFESDLEDDTTIETRTGIEVEKQCWGLKLELKDESAERTIAFMVTLNGIGEFGSK